MRYYSRQPDCRPYFARPDPGGGDAIARAHPSASARWGWAASAHRHRRHRHADHRVDRTMRRDQVIGVRDLGHAQGTASMLSGSRQSLSLKQGPHLEAIRKNGPKLIHPRWCRRNACDSRARGDLRRAGLQDLVLLAAKAYTIAGHAPQMRAVRRRHDGQHKLAERPAVVVFPFQWSARRATGGWIRERRSNRTSKRAHHCAPSTRGRDRCAGHVKRLKATASAGGAGRKLRARASQR